MGTLIKRAYFPEAGWIGFFFRALNTDLVCFRQAHNKLFPSRKGLINVLFNIEISSYFIAMLKQRGNGFRNITSRYFIYFDEACLLMNLSLFRVLGRVKFGWWLGRIALRQGKMILF